jgi:hypothetical protein
MSKKDVSFGFGTLLYTGSNNSEDFVANNNGAARLFSETKVFVIYR